MLSHALWRIKWWLEETESSRPHLLVQRNCSTYPKKQIEGVEKAAQALHGIFSGHCEPRKGEAPSFHHILLPPAKSQRSAGAGRTGDLSPRSARPAHPSSARPQPGPESGPKPRSFETSLRRRSFVKVVIVT